MEYETPFKIQERNAKAQDLFDQFALQGTIDYKEFMLGLHELGIFPVMPMAREWLSGGEKGER